MSWLVTGGAGYIGAHVVRALEESDLEAVVVDDLSSGHRGFVRGGTPFVEGTILDTDLLVRTCKEHAVEGVVLLAGKTPRINGDDYATPDGTCVRDFVHVTDLAVAHVAAARALAAGEPLEPVYNLGSGDGSSVREIMDTVREVTGIDFTPEIGPRRPGDPARIVASGQLAARDLDWAMRHDLRDMVASAWKARTAAS
jgi:UDP-glucose 4-epimerase